MRVLMVAHRFPPDAVAGVERYTESLAGRMSELGDSVTVVSRRPGPGPVRAARDTDRSDVSVVRLQGGGVHREDWLHLRGPLDACFAELLDDIEPDVVHANHLVDLSPGFLALAREAGAGVVLTLHDFWFPCPRITLRRPDGTLCAGPEGGEACVAHCVPAGRARDDRGAAGDRLRLRALYFRRLLDLPDRVVCPSPYVANWFEGWGIEPGRIRPVPNGIRLPAERPDPGPPRRNDRLRLVILGAVVRHKGIHVALEALESAGVPADLSVHGPLGDAEYVRELRARAEDISHLRLRLFGPYDPSELSFLLEDADVLLAPSIWPETFCLVVREALCRGVPAITTKLGALPDAVEHGVSGFQYDHDDPRELGELLTRVATEPRLLDRLRAGARAAPVPSLEDHADRIRGEYHLAREHRLSNAARAAAAVDELASIERLLGGEAASPAIHQYEGVA